MLALIYLRTLMLFERIIHLAIYFFVLISSLRISQVLTAGKIQTRSALHLMRYPVKFHGAPLTRVAAICFRPLINFILNFLETIGFIKELK